MPSILCDGAYVGDKFCRDTPDQRGPRYRPFHTLLALFLFWLRPQATGLMPYVYPLSLLADYPVSNESRQIR